MEIAGGNLWHWYKACAPDGCGRKTLSLGLIPWHGLVLIPATPVLSDACHCPGRAMGQAQAPPPDRWTGPEKVIDLPKATHEAQGQEPSPPCSHDTVACKLETLVFPVAPRRQREGGKQEVATLPTLRSLLYPGVRSLWKKQPSLAKMV